VIDSLGAGTGSAVSGTVIPNGVDWQRLAVLPPRTESRRGLGLSEEAVILFLGRLTAEKGVRVLAEAAAALRRQREDIVVLIAGDGPERGRLEGAAHATPSLRLLGAREDVPELMSACDLVVVPSLREGQSLVALEAMAAGRPLLVSGVGGLAELAAASGACWTVAPGQPGELAHGLASLLAQPQERANLAARGLAYAQEHGDWRQMVRRVAAVYRESMEDR
jgi:glycosyltransferase involved in cell wall biosynthesis